MTKNQVKPIYIKWKNPQIFFVLLLIFPFFCCCISTSNSNTKTLENSDIKLTLNTPDYANYQKNYTFSVKNEGDNLAKNVNVHFTINSPYFSSRGISPNCPPIIKSIFFGNLPPSEMKMNFISISPNSRCSYDIQSWNITSDFYPSNS